MNDQNVRYLDMFGRAISFGRDNAADFSPTSQSALNFAKLVSIGQEITAFQAEAGGGSVSSRSALLAQLRLELKNLARTAREIDDDEPGFADKFRLPANSAQSVLLETGRKIVAELKGEGVVARFTAYEVPDTIVVELETLLKDIDNAKDEQDSGEVEGVENTAGLKLAFAAGKKLVDKLDAAMKNKYKNQPAKLAAWDSASHIERAPKRKKAATSAETNSTPATSAPAN